jgi:hypothetical protein
MFIIKDFNMNGVCDWLDPKVLDIWLVDAPLKDLNIECNDFWFYQPCTYAYLNTK